MRPSEVMLRRVELEAFNSTSPALPEKVTPLIVVLVDGVISMPRVAKLRIVDVSITVPVAPVPLSLMPRPAVPLPSSVRPEMRLPLAPSVITSLPAVVVSVAAPPLVGSAMVTPAADSRIVGGTVRLTVIAWLPPAPSPKPSSCRPSARFSVSLALVPAVEMTLPLLISTMMSPAPAASSAAASVIGLEASDPDPSPPPVAPSEST